MKDVSIGMVGAGYWGKNLVRNFYQLNALRMVMDPNAVLLEQMTTDYAGLQTTTSYADVINAEHIQAVAIATPAETHLTLAKEALLAGKDVFVEKPLCLNEQDAQDLIDLAKAHQRILMVGHLLWYHPALLKLKELVHEGELGKLRYLYSNRLNMGKLRREENVLWSFAPHDVSVMLGLLNDLPVSVTSQAGNYLHRDIADVTVSCLDFASGVRAHMFVSWLHPFKEQKLVVVGDRKMAAFDDTQPWESKLKLYAHDVKWPDNIPIAIKAEATPVQLVAEEPLRAECQHFIDCVRTRRPPRTDGQEGIRVLRVLNACQRAIESGHQEKIETMIPAVKRQYFIDSTAQIDPNVEIGAGTQIWHFSHILKDTRIGEKCNLGQNVVVGPRVQIGNNCKIQNNVSIYEGVTLENHVFCGPSMVFTNVNNPRSEVRRMHELCPTLVKQGASLGANCTVVCGITIGEYAFVGAGAVVIRDIPDYALVVGNPARHIGWMSRHGERLNLPVNGDGEATCPATGERYRVRDGHCYLIE